MAPRPERRTVVAAKGLARLVIAVSLLASSVLSTLAYGDERRAGDHSQPVYTDRNLDPNFQGSGENAFFVWYDNEVLPQVTSKRFGRMSYLGFDPSTGTSYLRIPGGGGGFLAYVATSNAPPLVIRTEGELPAKLTIAKRRPFVASSQRPSVGNAPSSGPIDSGTRQIDPNFPGTTGENEFFIWKVYDNGSFEVRAKDAVHPSGLAVQYQGYDPASGNSYLTVFKNFGTSEGAAIVYRAGNGPPYRGSPSVVLARPKNLGSVGGAASATSTVSPGGTPSVGAATVVASQLSPSPAPATPGPPNSPPAPPFASSPASAGTLLHEGQTWKVAFTENGVQRSLALKRPHVTGGPGNIDFVASIWAQPQFRTGQGMWTAMEKDGTMRVITAVPDNAYASSPQIVRVDVGPALSREQWTSLLLQNGVVYHQDDP